MEDYTDKEKDGFELQLKTSEWTRTETDKLLKEYKACKTSNAQHKMRKRLEYMKGRLILECKNISKLMDCDEYGNEYE